MLTAAVMEHTLRNHEPHYPWLSEQSMRLVDSLNVIFQDWENEYPSEISVNYKVVSEISLKL